MKVFHELVFDGTLSAAQGFQFFFPYSDPRLGELMGAVDVLNVSGYATQVSGTNPALSIGIDHSNDRNIWYSRSFFPIIFSLPLSTTGETLFAGGDVNPLVSSVYAFTRLSLVIGGDSALAYVRVWVTGRDFSRRSAPKANAPGQVPGSKPQMAQHRSGNAGVRY